MKQSLLILFATVFTACNEEPKLPISNTLEINLGNKLSAYVENLNKAFNKDTTALSDFFKIDYINNAAGYDHGFVLYQLLEKFGDKEFAHVLEKTDKKDLQNVIQYIEVGLDANDLRKEQVKRGYPISSGILHIK